MVISAKKQTVMTVGILLGCLFMGYFYSVLFHSVEKAIPEPVSAPAPPLPLVTTQDKNFFEDYRLERDKMRSKQVELFNDVVKNPDSAADTRKEAQEKLLSIAEKMEKEVYVETVLAAKGFKDAVVFIQQENVTVVINNASMLPQDNEKLQDMVSQLTNISNEDVVVVAKP